LQLWISELLQAGLAVAAQQAVVAAVVAALADFLLAQHFLYL